MKIAVVQFRPAADSLSTNLRNLAAMVRAAARNGAKLIICPELALSKYSFMSASEAKPYAERLSDFDPAREVRNSSMDVFYDIARSHSAHIIWGLIEESASGKLFNSQVLMCPDGSFESYSKLNRFSTDYLWATAGAMSPPVRKIRVGGHTYKVGLLVCRDVRDKSDELKSLYEPGDADIIGLSAGWGLGAFPATAWMEFAASNKVTLAVANRYGRDVPNDFGVGGICIIRPDMTVTCEGLVWNADCIVYGEV